MVYLDGRVSGKSPYITIDLVHVSSELLARELFIDLTETRVGDAAGWADGVGGLVESESPRVPPMAVPVWGLADGWQVPPVHTLQYKRNIFISYL